MRKKGTEQEYLELVREIFQTLEIEMPKTKSLDSLLHVLQKQTLVPYWTSTQRDIVRNLGNIVNEINDRRNMNSITKKMNKLKDAVLFDRYFE